MDDPDRPDFDPDASLRSQLAEAVASEAAFSGWSLGAMRTAARHIGAPEGEAERLFPGGPVAVLAWLSERADLLTVEAMEAAGASGLKIRERIKTAVRARIERTVGGRESVRRGLAMLALPPNAPLGLKLLYRTVDALWYAAGDTSTDFNFYTKRATLAGVYSATLFYWLNDRSEGSEATWGFLDRRIDNVMRFEKWKADLGTWRGPKRWAARRPNSRHR
ncbi:COQ9 family protein [Reyranella sp.]|uniref:COQ9 family protein n=1 Tax=Reyranella sp. TaxID=1929291 RepID=UPI003D0C3544